MKIFSASFLLETVDLDVFVDVVERSAASDHVATLIHPILELESESAG